MRTEFLPCFAALLAASLLGCPGTLDDENRFRVDAGGDGEAGQSCDPPTQIFAKPDKEGKPTCTDLGCHNAPKDPSKCTGGTPADDCPANNLDLASPDVVGRLRGKPSKGGATHLLVDPGDVSKSALITKAQKPPPFGLPMPLGKDPLTAAELACLKSWITSELAKGPGDAGGGDTGSGDAASDAPADATDAD